MNLQDLLAEIDIVEIIGDCNINIENLVYDSRHVDKGALFFAIKGLVKDGHDFIDEAIDNGAVAIIIESELNEYRKGIVYIRVHNVRLVMSFLAASFYGHPLRDLKIIGITGTNGKTTTSFLIKNILESAGYQVGLVGTIKNVIGSKDLPAQRTTPESVDLHKFFADMKKLKLDYVVMEVSSHAIDLKRTAGIEFDCAVFTNITQDHLDYHVNFEDYLAVKSSLFSQVKTNGACIINKDADFNEVIAAKSAGQVYFYGLKKDADLTADEIELKPDGVSFKIHGLVEDDYSLKLTGKFNIYNALAAVTTARAFGIEAKECKLGLEKVNGVPGRFQLLREGQKYAVVVDYAHTPDGMRNVLATARELITGKLIVVFGCGGDRDRTKRPQMGKVAAQFGDLLIVTNDNPRNENPNQIFADIEKSLQSDKSDYQIIEDRRAAIYTAINSAQGDDMVIILGKGHETYQIFKNETIDFDDREVAREAIRDKEGVLTDAADNN